MMAKDNNTTLSHVYGLAGLVPAVVGLLYLVKTDAPWQEYALLVSGWVVACVYGAMLWRSFNQARADGETVGALTERVKALEKELLGCLSAHAAELDRRQATQDYLASQLMGQQALPRTKTMRTQVPNQEGEAE